MYFSIDEVASACDISSICWNFSFQFLSSPFFTSALLRRSSSFSFSFSFFFSSACVTSCFWGQRRWDSLECERLLTLSISSGESYALPSDSSTNFVMANVKSNERSYPLPPEASPLPQIRYCTSFFRSSQAIRRNCKGREGQEGHEVLCYFALHTWRKFLPMVRQPHYRTCTLMLSGHQIKLHRPRSVVLDPFGPLVVKPAHGLQSVCVVS